MRFRPFSQTGFAVLFLVGLAMLDAAAGAGLRRWLGTLTTGTYSGSIAYAMKQSDHQVLIFGSSRARHHVDPDVIEEELGQTAFNLGANGQGIYYQLMMASLVLESPTGRASAAKAGSKVVILVALVDDLSEELSDRARVLAPYADEDATVDSVLSSEVRHGRLKLMSRSYRFNSLLLSMIDNTTKSVSVGFNGFEPLGGAMVSPPVGRDHVASSPVRSKVQEAALRAYSRFIELASQRGRQVVVLVGPRLRGAPMSDRERISIDRIGRTTLEAGAIFLPMTEDEFPVFLDPGLYRDAAHLNGTGAELFSRLLAGELASVLLTR
jgi:hypothetical protein